MLEAGHKALAIDDLAERARLFSTQVVPYFSTIRAAVDQLETLVDDSLWRLPKYRELLFVR
jgi:glutamine synthetase